MFSQDNGYMKLDPHLPPLKKKKSQNESNPKCKSKHVKLSEENIRINFCSFAEYSIDV